MTDRPEDPNTDALQALWQGQEPETPAMTLQAIRMLARNDANHMRNALFVGFTLLVVEALMFTPWLLKAPNGVMRNGWIIMLVGLAWMGWRMWRQRPSRLPDLGATTQTLIAFHRRELERRRTNYRSLMVTVAPLFAGMVLVVRGMQLARPHAPLANFAPIVVLAVVWFIWAGVLQRRQARRLQEQIDDLDRLSRGG